MPALLYNMAKAYDKLGDIDHAYDAYRLYADSAAADPKLKARADAARGGAGRGQAQEEGGGEGGRAAAARRRSNNRRRRRR